MGFLKKTIKLPSKPSPPTAAISTYPRTKPLSSSDPTAIRDERRDDGSVRELRNRIDSRGCDIRNSSKCASTSASVPTSRTLVGSNKKDNKELKKPSVATNQKMQRIPEQCTRLLASSIKMSSSMKSTETHTSCRSRTLHISSNRHCHASSPDVANLVEHGKKLLVEVGQRDEGEDNKVENHVEKVILQTSSVPRSRMEEWQPSCEEDMNSDGGSYSSKDSTYSSKDSTHCEVEELTYHYNPKLGHPTIMCTDISDIAFIASDIFCGLSFTHDGDMTMEEEDSQDGSQYAYQSSMSV